MVFFAHVAEDLLNLAHDKPGRRNVFMRKTLSSAYGDALELYKLNRAGVLEPRTVVDGFLANQPFNKAIFSVPLKVVSFDTGSDRRKRFQQRVKEVML
jgi:hypothetical protein